MRKEVRSRRRRRYGRGRAIDGADYNTAQIYQLRNGEAAERVPDTQGWATRFVALN